MTLQDYVAGDERNHNDGEESPSEMYTFIKFNRVICRFQNVMFYIKGIEFVFRLIRIPCTLSHQSTTNNSFSSLPEITALSHPTL